MMTKQLWFLFDTKTLQFGTVLYKNFYYREPKFVMYIFWFPINKCKGQHCNMFASFLRSHCLWCCFLYFNCLHYWFFFWKKKIKFVQIIKKDKRKIWLPAGRFWSCNGTFEFFDKKCWWSSRWIPCSINHQIVSFYPINY